MQQIILEKISQLVVSPASVCSMRDWHAPQSTDSSSLGYEREVKSQRQERGLEAKQQTVALHEWEEEGGTTAAHMPMLKIIC